MSQATTLSSALTAAQLAAMDGEHIVKMGRELIAQLGDDPDRFHGNIWPGNIHLDEDGKAVLGEGCDAPVSARTPEQIEYMAPEAFWENRFGRDADLYSIALLMYTAYNGGCLPFTATQTPEDTGRAQALRTRMKGGEIPMPSGASEAVAAILNRALSYEAKDRYATAGAMLHALSDTDEALPSQAPEEEPVSDPQAAAAAAATGMAGVSLVAELAAIPRDQMRPVETQAGVSASSILMEQELRDIDRGAPKAPVAADPEPLADIFAEPKPVKAEAEMPEAAEAPVAEEAPVADAAKAPETVEEEVSAEASADTEVPEAPAAKAEEPISDAPAAAADKPKTPAKSGGKSKKKKRSAPKPVAGIVDLPTVPEKTKAEEPETPQETAVLPEAPQETVVLSETPQETAVLPEKSVDTGREPTQSARQSAPKNSSQKKSPQTANKPTQTAKKPPQKPAQTQSDRPASAAAKKKQYMVSKDIDRREEAAARRKNRRGAILAIGVGVLVVAGLIGVTAYSLGAFEKEQPVTLVTAEPTAEATPAPTDKPAQTESAVTVPEYHFKAVAASFDWEELKNVGLAVLDGQDAFDAAVAAAEEAKLENAWIGARWLDAADAPDGEAGWYWLDDTQLPENSSFWAENEPSTGSGGRLMLRRMANGDWRFHAVTREQYESGEYEKLGCITDGSGMAAVPSPAPTATPEPTSAPTQAPSSYSAYVPTYTATATTAPTSAPEGGSAATPSVTATPEATAAPEKYLAETSTRSWSALTAEERVTLADEADFTAVTEFLDAYNTAHADAPLHNVWLGAEYCEADADAAREAGWYWTNGMALSAEDSHWAAEQTGAAGSKLMLRYVGGSWSYYAVSDTEFETGLGTTYINCGLLKLNPAAE